MGQSARANWGSNRGCDYAVSAHNRHMIGKEFDAIVKEDIDALVQNAVCERRDTEYKQQLPGGSDEEAREFLADVSSLANASGGDLIYGVRDKRDDKGQPTGIPEAVDGLGRINSDAEERRLLNMLRDGIDPRIPGIRIKHLDGYPSGPVIVSSRAGHHRTWLSSRTCRVFSPAQAQVNTSWMCEKSEQHSPLPRA